MKTKYLIPKETLCLHYDIEYTFVDALHNIGLIEIEIIEHKQYLHQDQIRDFEKMIRLHHELNVNLEGIDVVFNLLRKEKALRDELIELKNRLDRYEKF
jgi:hypothetical protein